MTTESERDIAVELMPAPLVNKLTDIEKSLEGMRTGAITSYHKLGKTLKLVQDDPDRYRGTDGTPGIDLLMQATGNKHESTLRTALRFADQYTEDDLKTLLELTNKKSGFQLIWGHVVILLTIGTKADRKKWAARAVREDMSPRDLHTTLKQEEGREGGHGRPFKVPPTISKQLTAMQKDLAALLKKNEQSWNGDEHSTFDNILSTTDEELDDDWLLQVEEVIASLTKLQEVVATNLVDAGTCASRIRSVIDAREAAATREAEAVTTMASTAGGPARAVQLDDADDAEDPVPAAPVRRSSGRRTVAEV